jgi:uncharacterized protein
MTDTTISSPIRERIASLDVVRGVAVMGIFSVNVIAFAMIFPAYMNPSAYGGYSGENLAVWLANFVLIDGKMRGLFSILFGASMLLVIDRARASGRSAAKTHYARMIVLLLFGLFHFYVIWFGDILALYALTGMIAYLFHKRTTKTMLAWATGLMIASIMMFSFGAMQMRKVDLAAHAPTATAKEIRRWNDNIGMLANVPAETARDTAVALSPLPKRAEHMVTKRGSEPFMSLFVFGLPTLALMLIGMAGYRSGFLTGAWDRRRYRKVALFGLGIGGAGSLLLGLWVIQSGFYLPLIFAANLAIAVPFQLMMALGYAALIILAARRDGVLTERIAAVGRTAFTNYLGTSIIAALIFYGDGLALFGKLSRFEAWLFVPCVWALMLLWSKPWLDHFRYGPFEWAWRSLARWEFQPMRKRVMAPAVPAEA